jgi:Tol biopolymer transport system component
VAVNLREGQSDIWVYELERGVKTRYTFDTALDVPSAWTASGTQLIFSSMRSGNPDVYLSGAGGEATLLVGTPAPEFGADISADGRHLIYNIASPENTSDLFFRELGADGKFGEPVLFVKGSPHAAGARFSPDGKLVAYISEETGGPEIYVRDFPHGAQKWQLSVHGGTWPRWRRDGKEIFYVESRSRSLMAAPVSTKPPFSTGTPVMLFEKSSLGVRNMSYDVSSDGKRFIILEKPSGQPLSIHVVENWYEEFRK